MSTDRPGTPDIQVPVAEATDHQVLIALYRVVTRLEIRMSAQSDALDRLGEAIAALKQRAGARFDRLVQELAALKEADAAEDSVFQDRIASLEALVAELQADSDQVVSRVDAAVSEINAASPEEGETPVELPTEPPVEDPNAPHPDQTLPGDLPGEQA